MRPMARKGTAAVPAPPHIEMRYFDDQKWISEHAQELTEQYPDQWIAVYNKEVVTAGKDAGEVLRSAKEKTGGRDIALELLSSIRMLYPSIR